MYVIESAMHLEIHAFICICTINIVQWSIENIHSLYLIELCCCKIYCENKNQSNIIALCSCVSNLNVYIQEGNLKQERECKQKSTHICHDFS